MTVVSSGGGGGMGRRRLAKLAQAPADKFIKRCVDGLLCREVGSGGV